MAVSGANIAAITQSYLVPKAVDTVLNGNILTLRLLGNAKPWRGRTLDFSVITTKQSNGSSYSGLDTFATNKSATKQRLSFDARAYEIPVVIEGMERDVASSDPQASVDLIAEAMEEAENAMLDDLATMFYGDGTGNSSKDFLGLAAIVDDGGEVATYGGLARSTYTTLKANEYDVTGAVTLASLATADAGARKGSDRISLHVTTEARWAQFESLLQATVSHNVTADGYKQVTRTGIVQSKAALAGEMGFDSLFFRGAPVVADQKCTADKWFGLNEKYLAFYGLKSANPKHKLVSVGGNKEIDGVYSDVPSKNMGIHFIDLMDSINQDAQVGHFLIKGNLVSQNPNRHFTINFS